MTDWTQHLPDKTIIDIQRGLVQAGLATDQNLNALLIAVNNQYAAGLPGGGLAPNLRLMGQLQSMNKVHNLRNGDVPLNQWLVYANAIAEQYAVGDIIDSALLILSGEADAAEDVAAGEEAAPVAGEINTDIAVEAMVAGSDETLSIRYLREGVEAARSVFKLLVHRHADGHPEFTVGDTPRLVNATGWMIGPRLLITNHHVVNARMKGFITEPDATEQDFSIQAESMSVLYDYYEVDNPTHTQVTGEGALVAANKNLDFAILRLPADAPERPPMKLRTNLIRKNLTQALGTRVNVLQHPNGDPMRIGFRDNFVTIGDENRLAYLTDTASGSSGSPVCDDGWSVAALHAGSQSVSDKNIEIRGRKIKRENVGTPIPTILANLMADHSDLHDEILAAQV